MAKVSLNKAGKDLYAAVQRAIEATAPGLIQPGDCVLIKPNLVMPQAPDSSEITNPLLIEAVARYCLDSDANRVIIGEGPGCINRKSQLKECFVSSGVIEIAGRLGVDWVLFDDHGYRSFKDISDCTPAEFRVTEYAFSCDKIINLAALKTHYLTTVTLAMKNLKGFLKYEDKPLFHQPDIHRAIVELNKIIRPSFNIIDATHWKHGGGLLIAGTDIVAVDSAGCALMGIDPSSIRMISLGADRGLGEK
ncbi:MAG TPA: DUF362 domain-containing protein, partial [Dehalococcoidia bacterium]|nr:DUF362 domain-containing protein [Dehalococcoidia bacterium]